MIAAIILAAGASSRLGTPKQNIAYGGKTLLQHAIEAAHRAGCQPVVVVLGAHADAVEEHLSHFHTTHATLVYNNDWKQGMSSSIAVGVKALQQMEGDIAATIIMVCDQPYVDASLLHTLMEQYRHTGKGIVASKYGKTEGVPALFSDSYFDALMELSGDSGAKNFILRHGEDVALVPFEKGVVDIDTIQDVEKFRAGKK